MRINRRELLLAAGAAAASAPLEAAASKTRVGIVASTHGKLPRPASPEDPLDYERVRDMVWKAIEYGKPRAGSLEAKIRPGSWVVVKPNMGLLRPQPGYTQGDITDLRVTRAVLEYLARHSRAARITVAEGGNPALQVHFHDGHADQEIAVADGVGDAVIGARAKPAGSVFRARHLDAAVSAGRVAHSVVVEVDVIELAAGEPPGELLDHCAQAAAGSGELLAAPVEGEAVHTGPVLLDHVIGSGIVQRAVAAACLKNYVGTAPREFYAGPRAYSNAKLHAEHSLEGRIDSFIADLSAFHPPDYCVVDAIRGLQYAEHNRNLPDQMVRSNMVVAGEDAVATDAVLAYLMGFNPWDIDFLHMAASRETGTNDMGRIDVLGDDAGRLRRRWAKPRNWFGRGNREWLLTRNPESNLSSWQRQNARTDTVDFPKVLGAAPVYSAAVRVRATGAHKAFLWVGTRGRVMASLNGQKVLEEENRTRYRIGQFQAPVELRSGENLLVFRVETVGEQAQLSALLVGERNDGDTLEGIRWSV